MLPPGCARLATNPLPTGSAEQHKDDGNGVRLLAQSQHRLAAGKDRIGVQIEQLFRDFSFRVAIGCPTDVEAKVGTLNPAEVAELTFDCLTGGLRHFRTGAGRYHHADPSHPVRRLCRRNGRPKERHAAEQRDEFAALRSITSSARASSAGGTVSPSTFA